MLEDMRVSVASEEQFPERRRHAVLLVCGLAIFVEVLGSGIVIPAIPEFAALFSAPDAVMSYAFALFAVAFLVAILPLGYVVDRTGYTGPVIVGGMLSVAAAALCFALAHTIWGFGAGQAFHGAGSAAVWVSAQPLAARVIGVSRRTGLWLSTITIAMGLGLVVGPLIGIVGSFRAPFWIYLAMTLGVAGSAALVLRGTRRAPGDRAARHPGAVMRNPRVLAASVAVLVLYAGVGAAEVLFPLFMDGFGYAKSGIGLLFSLFALCMVVSQPLAGLWIDRVGPGLPTVVGLIAAGAFLTVAVMGEAPSVWAPAFTALGLATGIPISASMVMIATGSRAAQHGAAYSMWNFSFALGYLLGPVIGGTVAAIAGDSLGSETGGLRIAFVVLSVCMVLAAPLVGWLSGQPRTFSDPGGAR